MKKIEKKIDINTLEGWNSLKDDRDKTHCAAILKEYLEEIAANGSQDTHDIPIIYIVAEKAA